MLHHSLILFGFFGGFFYILFLMECKIDHDLHKALGKDYIVPKLAYPAIALLFAAMTLVSGLAIWFLFVQPILWIYMNFLRILYA